MYQIHTLETAPEKSQQSLQGLKNSFGLIPNLAATMAESPTLINGFVGGFMNFHGGAFGTGERQVLLLTNAVANNCSWAVAFHSTMALKEGIDPEAIRTIRAGELPKDPKLAALSRLFSYES
jgi:AhpD family alkylhydroperoxidase